MLLCIVPTTTFAETTGTQTVTTNFAITTNLTGVFKGYGEMEITGKVRNRTSAPITGFTVGWSYDGYEYRQEFPDVTLQPGINYNYTLDEKLAIARNQTLIYTVFVEKDDARTETQGTVTAYVQKVVGEELTGTWCGWCPRGAVALENMRNKYPDTFIGIAVHGGDVMQYSPYQSAITAFTGTGYPGSTTNRDASTSGDPSSFESHYLTQYAKPLTCGVETEGTYDPETKEVTAKGKIYFATNYNNLDYRFSYIIIENNINVPGNSSYNQTNYYAGGGNGAMGGYESKPNPVPAADMHYQEVARYIGGAFSGIAESIPANVEAFTEYEHTFNFTLPTSILNYDELELVMIVIDGKTNKIINADKVELEAATPAYIRDMKDKPEVSIIFDNGNIYFDSSALIEKVSIVCVDCRTINSVKVDSPNRCTLATPGMKGIYIVQAQIGKKIYSYKVSL